MTRHIRAAKFAAGCAMLACVLLGSFGMRDGHQAKLPIVWLAAMLGWAYAKRRGWYD